MADLEPKLRSDGRKLAAVRQLGRILSSTLDLDRLLVVLLEKVTELLDAERATLFLRTEEGHLESKVFQGGEVASIHLRPGEGLAGWVAESGATVNLPDAYADPRFNQEVDRQSGFRTRSMLCMAMPNHQGHTIGVMQVLNKRQGAFSSDDEVLLGSVAAHAGIAIENSKLYASVVSKNAALLATEEELRQRIAELDLLFQLEREAAGAMALDELLARLLSRAIERVGAEAGSILLRERDSGELFFRTAQGERAKSLPRKRLAPGQGLVGWVAQHHEPLLVNDPSADPRHDRAVAEETGVAARQLLVVPLVAPPPSGAGAPESLGAIELINARRAGGRGFDEADLRLLTLIAGQASRAILLTRDREARLASERLAAIGQLMSGVLHDLKTPLTVVSAYVQLMAKEESPSERDEYVDQIQHQFDLMAAMTGEVLQFARGESQLLVRKVYLNQFVPDVSAQLEHSFADKKVRLTVDARYQGTAWFDVHKMYRLVHNLARNAADAMAEGGRFTFTVDRAGPELVLTFADTGCGIPEAMRGRLFEAFATAGKSQGTGLGLAIVKKIVDEHHGHISYDSRPGHGTTFRVALPLERPA